MVDIPIGLLDSAEPGGRECDRECRAMLSARGCCVFSAPVRGCLDATSPEEAAEISRASSSAQIAISRQAYGIIPKIREVDECMTHAMQRRVFEAHPELSFAEMNGGTPISASKRRAPGKAERRKLLEEHGFPSIPDRLDGSLRSEVAEDDILDAYVMLWTAERKHREQAGRVPISPPTDAKDLRMEIWR